MANGLGRRRRVHGEGRPVTAQVVFHGPVSVHEWVPAPGLRDFVPQGRVPIPVPPDAWLQRPSSSSLPLHGAPDPGCGETHRGEGAEAMGDRKSRRLNSSHSSSSYADFCLKKKKNTLGLRCCGHVKIGLMGSNGKLRCG